MLGYDRCNYDLVLKVVYQLGEGIIPLPVICNDEYLGFLLDEVSISIQHRTPLCASVIERTIPAILNPTQTTKEQKIQGHKVVLRKPASEAPINDDPRVDPSLSLYYE